MKRREDKGSGQRKRKLVPEPSDSSTEHEVPKSKKPKKQTAAPRRFSERLRVKEEFAMKDKPTASQGGTDKEDDVSTQNMAKSNKLRALKLKQKAVAGMLNHNKVLLPQTFYLHATWARFHSF